MFRLCFSGRHECSLTVFVLIAISFLCPLNSHSQGASNELGNGGRHAIQGRLYVASGRRSQVSGLKIRLENSSSGDISILTDESGTFIFRNLNGGSYRIVIEGGHSFENYSESVYIDAPGSSSLRTNMRLRDAARTVNVQIHLRPKSSSDPTAPPGVLNAKWATAPRGAIEHYDRGLRLVRENNDMQAASEFRKALELSSGFAPAYVELGKIFVRASKLQEAVDAWKIALRYDPSDFDTQLNVGVAYFNLKKFDDCEKALVDAAFLDRNAVTPHYYLGLLFVLKNDLNVAQKAFETARGLNGGKSLPNIHKYLGRIYKQKAMEKEAIQEFETYLKLSPNAADVDKVKKDISDMKAKQIKNAFV